MGKREQNESVVVVLEDSEGTETLFEALGYIEHEAAEYAVLLPQFAFDTDELVILRIVRNAAGDIEEYHGVDSFDTLEAVFDKFSSKYGREE